jgi:hypothetical protein
MADQGLLCRDCHEEGQPRKAGAVAPLPEPVHDAIYRRGDFSSLQSVDDDFDLFDADEGDAFSTLS